MTPLLTFYSSPSSSSLECVSFKRNRYTARKKSANGLRELTAYNKMHLKNSLVIFYRSPTSVHPFWGADEQMSATEKLKKRLEGTDDRQENVQQLKLYPLLSDSPTSVSRTCACQTKCLAPQCWRDTNKCLKGMGDRQEIFTTLLQLSLHYLPQQLDILDSGILSFTPLQCCHHPTKHPAATTSLLRYISKTIPSSSTAHHHH